MTDIFIDVADKGQQTATTCWLASYRILYAWRKADEMTIPGRIAKAGLDFAELKRRGLYGEEFVKCGTALGMQGRAVVAVRDYDLDTWENRLRAYGPHWIATVKRGTGHAMVVYGTDPDMHQLHVYDPYNREQVGTVQTQYFTVQGLRDALADLPFAVQVWDGAKS